jgi:hypothetical protein
VDVDYHAPPTVSEFMRSDAFFRLIAGPVGSGKTTGCIFELMRRSLMQAPAPDGFRYTRWAILRQTLGQLKHTVLKDISHWFSGIAHWKVSESTVHFQFGDVRSEWILLPLEEPEDRRRLLSMNLTGAFVSECIEIDYELMSDVAGRCGRFPLTVDGGASWYGIIADTNMPPEGTAWHGAMIDPPQDMQVFTQPGGLTPNAENLNYLPQTEVTAKLPVDHPDRIAQGRAYYERLARSNNENWVTRYVHAQFGPDPSGTAVYAGAFRPSFHCVDQLEPVPGMPLYVGQDFGRDPWAVICQVDYKGRLLVLEEIASTDMGLIRHCREHLRPRLMLPRYSQLPMVVIGDPAGIAKSQYDEQNAFDVLKSERFPCVPAGTNDIDTRLRAVEFYLLQQRDGGPAMIFDRSRCPKLVAGMAGMYRYSKTSLDVSKPLPDKNPWSHVADALQYAAMATTGNTARAVARTLRPKRQTRPGVRAAGWT